MSDEQLKRYILQSNRFKNGAVYIISKDQRLQRIK